MPDDEFRSDKLLCEDFLRGADGGEESLAESCRVDFLDAADGRQAGGGDGRLVDVVESHDGDVIWDAYAMLLERHHDADGHVVVVAEDGRRSLFWREGDDFLACEAVGAKA